VISLFLSGGAAVLPFTVWAEAAHREPYKALAID